MLFFYFFGLELLVLLSLMWPSSTVKKMSDYDGTKDEATMENPLTSLVLMQNAEEVFHRSEVEKVHIDSDAALEQEDVFSAAKELPASCAVRMIFKDVTYKLKAGSQKDLLKGISGVVRPRDLCAVMGLSGSGMSKYYHVPVKVE